MKAKPGYEMSKNCRPRGNILQGVAGATASQRSLASSSLLAAGVFLTLHTTFALADALAPDGVGTCITCHGAHGEGSSAGAPRLAGQNADYMSHALSMFKAGTRASQIMQPIARTLSDTEMRGLADFFATQKAPLIDAGASASPQLVLAGRQLAETGAANTAACFSCHAAEGKGNGARFPSIAGEPARFLIERLHEFQGRAQSGTSRPGSMTAVAATLDERQIEAAAAYLSELQP
ncbi:MAG TPA: c-type cytochrome [Steroidobacteraceae bacterium]